MDMLNALSKLTELTQSWRFGGFGILGTTFYRVDLLELCQSKALSGPMRPVGQNFETNTTYFRWNFDSEYDSFHYEVLKNM